MHGPLSYRQAHNKRVLYDVTDEIISKIYT